MPAVEAGNSSLPSPGSLLQPDYFIEDSRSEADKYRLAIEELDELVAASVRTNLCRLGWSWGPGDTFSLDQLMTALQLV